MKNLWNLVARGGAVRTWGMAWLCGAAVVAGGCDSDAGSASATTQSDASTSDSGSGDTMAAVFELIGTWATPFGTDDVITQTMWNKAKVVEFDNAANVGFTQEPADDPYNPNKFNKVIWTEPKNNSFYYCMVDYGKDSLALAKASTLTADASDPDTKGCGGKFPWTKATKK